MKNDYFVSLRNRNVKGVPDHIPIPEEDIPCDGCEFGKSKRAQFPPSSTRAEHPLDLIHMDLVEYPVHSIDGYKYTLTTFDDASSPQSSMLLRFAQSCPRARGRVRLLLSPLG